MICDRGGSILSTRSPHEGSCGTFLAPLQQQQVMSCWCPYDRGPVRSWLVSPLVEPRAAGELHSTPVIGNPY